jgi:hypothetical protein
MYDPSYISYVVDAVKNAIDPQWGYFAGDFNTGMLNYSRNINANAVIVES